MAAASPPGRVKTGQRQAGEPSKLVQRLPYKARVAAKGCHDVGLDRGIIGTGHIELRAGWDHDAREDAQILALCGLERAVRGHRWPQSNKLTRRCFIWSAM